MIYKGIIPFSVKFAAKEDTSSFFKYTAAGNEIIIFHLRSALQYNLRSFYPRENEPVHLCLYQIDCIKARMNRGNLSLYFLVCVQQ